MSNDYFDERYTFHKQNNLSEAEELIKLGKKYLTGNGVPEDDNKAFEYFKQAADMNHPEGLACLGEMYQYGYGCNSDYDKAAWLYQQSADLQCGKGEFRLGWLYLKADNLRVHLRRDVDKAKELYLRAYRHGYRDPLGILETFVSSGGKILL